MMIRFKNILLLVLCLFISTTILAQFSGSEFKKVKVVEILQVSSYTYLLVEDGAENRWLAVPHFEAKIGGVYYCKGGMEMVNFKSKELNRTFESVYFVSSIYDNPFEEEKTTFKHSSDININKDVKPVNKKLNLTIEPENGAISIADLIKNKEKYVNKRVKIKGQVTKYISKVMSKNWIHLQDGTEFEGKFDLTLTSNEEVKIGDIITIEGIVLLDKDFGYGYFYDLIVENCSIIE